MKSKKQNRTEVLQVRLTAEEHRRLRREARRRGVTMAELLMGPWRRGGGR